MTTLDHNIPIHNCATSPFAVSTIMTHSSRLRRLDYTCACRVQLLTAGTVTWCCLVKSTLVIRNVVCSFSFLVRMSTTLKQQPLFVPVRLDLSELKAESFITYEDSNMSTAFILFCYFVVFLGLSYGQITRMKSCPVRMRLICGWNDRASNVQRRIKVKQCIAKHLLSDAKNIYLSLF